ncbi:LpxI family protein [Tropicimonas sp.]|uniref:LpxI family protein n=1 Tax=Tropicimonas sp. TaxID=2067044 RepID=UPI003A8822AB
MLALIAGRGRLPELLAGQVRREGRGLVYCAFHDTPPGPVAPDIVFRLETLGSLVRQLRRRGVDEVCLAGGIRRPRLNPLRLSLASLPLIPRFVAALRQGDDGALRAVLELFEENGMKVRAAQEIMPSLLPDAGVLTRARPDASDRADAARGAEIVAAMGQADVGQACVVAHCQALAIEAMPGTDWMLASLAGRRDGLPGGGLLYKAPKPTQDRRVDLPAIGPGTVAGAVAAGLRGVVIEAGGVLVLDLKETVAAADAAGLYLWVRAPERG